MGRAMHNKGEETTQNMEILNTRSGREVLDCNFEANKNSMDSLPPHHFGFTNKRENKLTKSKNSKIKIIDNRLTSYMKQILSSQTGY